MRKWKKLQLRTSQSQWLMVGLILGFSSLLTAEHVYGPNQTIRGESIGPNSGAQFGLGNCNFLSNGGVSALPKVAYGGNGGGNLTPPPQVAPSPSTQPPPSSATSSTGTSSNNDNQASKPQDTGASTSNATRETGKDPKDQDKKPNDAAFLEKGREDLNKCVACHKGKAGVPQNVSDITNVPDNMPPNKETFQGDVAAIKAYLASKK